MNDRTSRRRELSNAEDAISGWIAYGHALNEGRDIFPKGDNERFSEWVSKSQLAIWADGSPIGMDERAAAMWVAGFPEQFQEAKAAGNARTVRGIHAKWKEILAEREAKAARAQAVSSNLDKTPHPADRAAAMWACRQDETPCQPLP